MQELPVVVEEEDPTFLPTQQDAVVRIQSHARGNAARRDVQTRREQQKGHLVYVPETDSFVREEEENFTGFYSPVDVDPRPDHQGQILDAPYSQKAEDVLLAGEPSRFRDLDSYSTQEQKAVVRIQTRARGNLSRSRLFDPFTVVARQVRTAKRAKRRIAAKHAKREEMEAMSPGIVGSWQVAGGDDEELQLMSGAQQVSQKHDLDSAGFVEAPPRVSEVAPPVVEVSGVGWVSKTSGETTGLLIVDKKAHLVTPFPSDKASLQEVAQGLLLRREGVGQGGGSPLNRTKSAGSLDSGGGRPTSPVTTRQVILRLVMG